MNIVSFFSESIYFTGTSDIFCGNNRYLTFLKIIETTKNYTKLTILRNFYLSLKKNSKFFLKFKITKKVY